MRTYGNLMNRISEHTRNPEPAVGMGVTVSYWSDRSAGTVVRVSPSGKTLWFTGDRTTVAPGTGGQGAEEYSYTPNPDGTPIRAFKRPNGTWRVVGGNGLSLGYRNAYRDPSF